MAIITPSEATLADAGRHLRSGGLVGFPTETVYGLAADATSEQAVATLFEFKGRPRFNPLIIHVLNLAMAEKLGELDRRARYLAQRQWPGPLTLVVRRRADSPVARLATAGLNTVALRMPDHPVALQLIAAAGRPLAGPSANRSGQISPTLAEHVEAGLGRSLQMVLDGGPCRIGVESTVVDLTGALPTILRPGGVSREVIAASLGEMAPTPADGPVRGPGMTPSHYAPRLKLLLDPEEPDAEQALLAFGPAPLSGFAKTLNLSEKADLVEAAANLFAYLHELDQPDEFTAIAAMTVPERGLGIAINDRLRRAAAAR